MTMFKIFVAYVLMAAFAGSLFFWAAYRMRNDDDGID